MIRVGDFKIEKAEKEAINQVLDSGRISEGRKTREFEEKWAEFVGTKYSIALSSGTAALIAGLEAVKHYKNIPNGSNVITSPLTYISTVNAISLTNLNPVFVDVDLKTFGITPESVKRQLDKDSAKLILPVHLMGYACDMDKINKIAEENECLVFEDSAQAHGTKYNGKKTGSMSLLSDFSFYIAHNIQAGEMGAINTNDKEVARLVKKLKTNGRMCDCNVCKRPEGLCARTNENPNEDFDPRFTHDIIGYNFKCMDFQAALAVVQLQRADEIIKKRQENVKYLNEGLKEHENILQLPKYSEDVSYLAYPLMIKNPEVMPRRTLREKLEKKGIETRPLFGCIPTQQPAYSHLKEEYEGRLPNAEYLGKNAFYIGCHQYLEKKDLDHIVSSFKEIFK